MMEADKCISTSSPAAVKNQLTINDLDDNSLGMIFNKLPQIDRVRIESVCQHWYAVSIANWCIYSNRLTIRDSTARFLPSHNNTTKKETILEKILQRSGPYLEEIIIIPIVGILPSLNWIRFKWIAEHCPKLKRFDAGLLNLNDDDVLACSNLEALRIRCFRKQKRATLGLLFRINKRLRQLEILSTRWLEASDFDHLDPGQLEVLYIQLCTDFELTAEVADKLAESLVELSSTIDSYPSKLQHYGKLKNLRYLDLKVKIDRINSFETEFIADIAKNCRKLECIILVTYLGRALDQNVFAPLFDLPYLRRLVIIVDENEMPCEERGRLLQRASHLEYFVIETCDVCRFATRSLITCYQHTRALYKGPTG